MNFSTLENSENRRTVRITLTAKHTMPNLGGFSLFNKSIKVDRHPLNASGHADPEDYPDEMNDVVQDMLDRDAGFSEGEIYDASAESDFLDPDEENVSIEDIFEKLKELGDKLGAQADEDDDDVLVFRTLGSMERKVENGIEIIEISYAEEDSMDNTNTVIRCDPTKPNSVSVMHSGSVMSALICEQGARHISAYQTPIMPFEVAVYTKKCEGGFTFDCGGSLELDYMVEIRGANMQRTQMTIDAVVL